MVDVPFGLRGGVGITGQAFNVQTLMLATADQHPLGDAYLSRVPAVTAADIAPPAGVEVHNPELHIATLNAKGKLEMELTVERGRGYVSEIGRAHV